MARTPEVNISLRASTSEVTRVTRRPTGLRSKKPTCMRCMWRKIWRAHVEHDLLAGPLHEVGLDELEQVGEEQRAEVEEGDLRDAGHRGLALRWRGSQERCAGGLPDM